MVRNWAVLTLVMAEALKPWKMRARVRVQNEWDRAHIREVTMNMAMPERKIFRYPYISPNDENESSDITMAS